MLKCRCLVLAVQYRCTSTQILDVNYERTCGLKCVCLHLQCSTRVLGPRNLVLSMGVLVLKCGYTVLAVQYGCTSTHVLGVK